MTSVDAHILYIDWVGHPAPLSQCYHATGSRHLSSTADRYPLAVSKEAESSFCPNCLTYQDKSILGRSPFCSKTTCQRCPMCLGSALVSAVVAPGDAHAQDGLCVYKCGGCGWTSQSCHLQKLVQIEQADSDAGVVVDRLELARSAEDLFLDLKTRRERQRDALEIYFSSLDDFYTLMAIDQHSDEEERVGSEYGLSWFEKSRSISENNARIRRLDIDSQHSLQDFEHNMIQSIPPYCFHLQAFNSCALHAKISDLLPLPTQLRVRSRLRCRAEKAAGKPGILVQPKLNPLDGDSSQRTGLGQWAKKDGSAIHVFPRVTIVQRHLLENGTCLLLQVNNPSLGRLRFRFNSSDYLGEPDWENVKQPSSRFKNVLVDAQTNVSFHSALNTSVLKELKPSATVELLSNEDSIIDSHGKGRDKPVLVDEWRPSNSLDHSSIELLGQSASAAWFVLSMAGVVLTTEAGVSAPLSLEIEIGSDSLSDSSVPRSRQLAPGQVDRLRIDMLVLLKQN